MIAAFAEALFASSLLMLLVLALRRPMARRFGAHAAYALWALPALRLVMPPLPGWPAPLASLASRFPALSAPLPAAPAGAGPIIAPSVPAPLNNDLTNDPTALLAAVWIIGMVLWVGWQVWRYHRFLAVALDGATLVTHTDAADIWATDAVAGPLATGIRRPRIFVPADFDARYAPAERVLALRHEAAHHMRGDILANVAGLAVLALHWWNPIAHIAWRAFRADQELACDATVLAGASGEERQSYGRAVLKSAAAGVPIAASAMNAKSQLKDRIAMMKHHDLPASRRLWGRTSAAALVFAGLALTAAATPPTPPAAPAASTASPAPPAPPSAAAAPASPAPPTPPSAPTRVIRTVIIKDGKVVENTTGNAVVLVPHNGNGKSAAARPDDLHDLEMLEAMAVSGADREPNGARPRIIITCKRIVGPGGATAGATPATADDCRPLTMAAATPPLRDSLLAARKSIEATPGLTDEQRRSALDGIDKAMADAEKRPAGK